MLWRFLGKVKYLHRKRTFQSQIYSLFVLSYCILLKMNIYLIKGRIYKYSKTILFHYIRQKGISSDAIGWPQLAFPIIGFKSACMFFSSSYSLLLTSYLLACAFFFIHCCSIYLSQPFLSCNLLSFA